MKRTLIFACLLACASLILPASSEAGLLGNSDFRCRFQRMMSKSRGFMDRWRNNDCCDNNADESQPTSDDGMAPAPAPEEAAPPPAAPADDAAPAPAADANA